MIKNENDQVFFTSTKYYQGRDKAKFGPPYTLTLGIPMNGTLSTTSKEVKDQNQFLKLVAAQSVSYEDLLGSSNYFATMINGGSKVEALAWNNAHLKLLRAQNKHTKVKAKNMTSKYLIKKT